MRTWRKLGLIVGVGALGSGLWAGPAAADPPVVTGTVAVGGTITVSSDEHTQCDGQSASVSLSRPIGNNNFIPIIIGSTPLVLGQPWSIQITIPATDQQGDPLLPGDVIELAAGGICFALGDQATFQMDEVLLTLGQPVQGTTTTTTTAPPETTTTAPPAPATTQPPAAAAAQELPRTGGGNRTVGVAGAALLAAGVVVVAASRRRAPGTGEVAS